MDVASVPCGLRNDGVQTDHMTPRVRSCQFLVFAIFSYIDFVSSRYCVSTAS